jgi:hypothetical protein
MSRFDGGGGGATATADAGCAEAAGPTDAATVDAAADAGDADAAADRADDTIGTPTFDAAGAACARACPDIGSGAGFAGVGVRLP